MNAKPAYAERSKMTGKTTTATLLQKAAAPERFPDFPPREDMQNWRYLYRPGILNSLSIHLAETLPEAVVMCEAPVSPSLSALSKIRIPDLSVTIGGDIALVEEQGGYAIDSQRKPLDFALEVASATTGEVDYTDKRLDYEEFGVLEYWRFDPTGGRYHDAPLAADRLVDGEYRQIEIVEESEGRLWGYSEVLGVELWWDEGILRLRDPATGEFLRTPEELNEAYLAAEGRADEERAAREVAEARIAEMEAELRRLRG